MITNGSLTDVTISDPTIFVPEPDGFAPLSAGVVLVGLLAARRRRAGPVCRPSVTTPQLRNYEGVLMGIDNARPL